MGRNQPRRPARAPAVSPEEQALFLQAVAGATPLDPRERVRLAPLPVAPPAPRVEPVVPAPVGLTIEGSGDVIAARAPGVNRAQIAELRAGRVRVEATLDLHGDSAAQATARLRGFLAGAATHRHRCVLIVHGSGLHSDGGLAVLRDAVLDQLVGPMSGYVRAFATASPRDGGAGATYVLVAAS